MLEKMGEGCFMSHKGEGNSGGKSGKSTESKELAQALWEGYGLEALADTVLVHLHSEYTVFF